MTDIADILKPKLPVKINRREAWGNIAKETCGLGFAEIASTAVSLGVVAVAGDIAPHLVDKCGDVIGKILQPHIDAVQNNLLKICKLEECKPDMTLSQEERAKSMGKTIAVVGTAGVLAFGVKLLTRTSMNRLLGVGEITNTGHAIKDLLHDIKPKAHDWKVVVADEGLHVGAVLFMNTVGAKRTDDLIRSTSSILQKWGFPKQKADNVAAMGMVWELPNIVGFTAGVGSIAKYHLNPKNQQPANLLHSVLMHPAHAIE